MKEWTSPEAFDEVARTVHKSGGQRPWSLSDDSSTNQSDDTTFLEEVLKHRGLSDEQRAEYYEPWSQYQTLHDMSGRNDGDDTRGGNLGDLRIPNKQLDPISTQCAKDCGKRIANLEELEDWPNRDPGERMSLAEDIDAQLRDSLKLPAVDFYVDANLIRDSILGMSNGDEVRVNPELFDQANPEKLISTMAHEYRHLWQDAVVNDEIPHPYGKLGRDELVEATRSYYEDSRHPVTYLLNVCERDANAFAEIATSRYIDEIGGQQDGSR